MCRSDATHPHSKGKFLLIAALSYVNSLEEKKSALISVRIHIQTRLQRYFGGGSFIIVVMDLFWFWFFLNLISKQLLHHIKKAPLKLTAKQELARALYI